MAICTARNCRKLQNSVLWLIFFLLHKTSQSWRLEKIASFFRTKVFNFTKTSQEWNLGLFSIKEFEWCHFLARTSFFQVTIKDSNGNKLHLSLIRLLVVKLEKRSWYFHSVISSPHIHHAQLTRKTLHHTPRYHTVSNMYSSP